MTAHPDQRYGDKTWSQHGEDFMLVNLFEMLPELEITWLDLGAHHPSNISNTKLLYDRGGHGVNVEANPNLIQAFQEARPRDINVNCGVGLENGLATFYMYGDTHGWNTFSKTETERFKDKPIVQQIQLPVLTLNTIVDTYCRGKFPSLLSCDIEGLDFDVLRNADFTLNNPAIICVETRRKDTQVMRAVLHNEGFGLYCRMGENLIFIHENCYHSLYR